MLFLVKSVSAKKESDGYIPSVVIVCTPDGASYEFRKEQIAIKTPVPNKGLLIEVSGDISENFKKYEYVK